MKTPDNSYIVRDYYTNMRLRTQPFRPDARLREREKSEIVLSGCVRQL